MHLRAHGSSIYPGRPFLEANEAKVKQSTDYGRATNGMFITESSTLRVSIRSELKSALEQTEGESRRGCTYPQTFRPGIDGLRCASERDDGQSLQPERSSSRKRAVAKMTSSTIFKPRRLATRDRNPECI